jgi:hypothetical protein
MTDLTNMAIWLTSGPVWVYALLPVWLILYNIIGLVVLAYLGWKNVVVAAPDICGTTIFWFYVILWPILLPYGIIRILIC